MNAEKLHEIVLALRQELDISDTMNFVNRAYSKVISTEYGQKLETELKEELLEVVKDAPSDHFSPAYREILVEIGGESFFGSKFKEEIERILYLNKPQDAKISELRNLYKRMNDFKVALDQCSTSLKQLNVGVDILKPGECEIGVLIPRYAIDNKLISFGEELEQLHFIFSTFSEAATGRKEDITIRTISSSDLVVYLDTLAPIAAFVAVCIERTVALYKQYLEIRKLRQDMKTQALPEPIIKDIDEYINKFWSKGIEKIAIEVLNEYHDNDDVERKNELTNAVIISLNKVVDRFDRGFDIDVRVGSLPSSDSQDEESEELYKAVESIQSATKNIRFMKLEGKQIPQLTESKENPIVKKE